MDVDITIDQLPDNGGSPITDIQWNLNNGTANSFSSNVIGTYRITAEPGDEIRIRAVNAVNANPSNWSLPKTIPASATQKVVNNSFDSGTTGWAGSDVTTDWTVTGGNLIINDRGPDFTHGVEQNLTLTANTDHTISVTFSAASVGVRVKMIDSGGTQNNVLTPLTTPGTYQTTFNTGPETNWTIQLSTTADGATATFNEVSVVEA